MTLICETLYFILFHTVSLIVSVLWKTWPGEGIQRLKVNLRLLKPERLGIIHMGLVSLRNAQAVPGWVHYQPRLQCQLLRYLPHFLATFLVENLAEVLNIPEPPAIQTRKAFTLTTLAENGAWLLLIRF